MHLIPGSHRQVAELFPRLAAEDDLISGGSISDIRDVAELAQPQPAIGKAGSVLLYSSWVVHAAVPFQNRRKQRALWTLSMARTDASPWTKLSNPWIGPERGFIKPFWEQTTPRVRSLFGWPKPGHAYYDDAALANLPYDLAPATRTRSQQSRASNKENPSADAVGVHGVPLRS